MTLSALLWDGEKSDDADFGFPLNLFTGFFMPPRDIDRSVLSKEAIDRENYNDGYLSAEDRLSGAGVFGFDEISINGLYNFLTFPKTAAGNLYLSAGFVSP